MPEKQNMEWKEIWKDEYLAWICGYANAQGGTLYIGKNDKGETVGLSNSHKLLEDLPNKIRDAMGIIVPFNLSTDDGKEYLEISVQPYPIAISYKGVYYYRSGSTIADVDDGVIKRFKKWAAKWQLLIKQYQPTN